MQALEREKMKRKNIKSVVHNFADSFQAFDYRISQYPLLKELCTLYKEYSIFSVDIDFIDATIEPKEARTKAIETLVKDYIEWLPNLCKSQNVEISIIKSLKVRVTANFSSATVYKSSRNERELNIKTDYLCSDDLNNKIKGTIEVNEIIKKQNFENF